MTPRDRRALMVGAVILAAAGLVRLAGVVRSEARARLDELDRARALLARSEDLATSAPGLTDSLHGRNAELVALAPLLLDGRTTADALAGLSALVSGFAAQSGLDIGQIAPGDEKRIGPFMTVTLRVRGEGDLEAVARLIEVIERGPQLLTAERLSIDREPRTDGAQVLNVELVVRGLALVPEDS